jgi:hypothetical protein
LAIINLIEGNTFIFNSNQFALSLVGVRKSPFCRVHGPFSSLISTRLLATAGVIPPEVIPDPYDPIETPAEVVELSGKLDDFPSKLVEMPERTSQEYGPKMEENAKLIWLYAKGQAKKNLIGKIAGFTGDAEMLFDQTRYQKKGDNPLSLYTNAMSNCKTSFSRRAWRYFWSAISIKVQFARDLQQRINPNLGITAEEFRKILPNLAYISKGFAYSSLTTQSKTYIMNTPIATKRADANEFYEWQVSKSNNLTRVIRLNISDIPFGYCPKEIQDFEMNPQNKVSRQVLEAKLEQLQIEAIKAIRTAEKGGTTFDLTVWLDSK